MSILHKAMGACITEHWCQRPVEQRVRRPGPSQQPRVRTAPELCRGEHDGWLCPVRRTAGTCLPGTTSRCATPTARSTLSAVRSLRTSPGSLLRSARSPIHCVRRQHASVCRAGPCVSACSLRTACAMCHVPCAMCHVPRAREALAGCVSAVSGDRRNAPRLKERPASSGAAP